MEWQGGNKQRPNYWQWRRSFIRGGSNWTFFQVGYPLDTPYRHAFEPKLNAQQCAICEAFFSKCFEQSTSWCFGSHFFVARSHRLIATCHCGFLASFLKRKSMERKLLCQLFTATNCSKLARHALKFARLLSIQFCSSRYRATRVSCLVLTSRKSRDRNPGFSAADDAAVRNVFVFIQINTFPYHRKMSMYQTNSVYVKLYLFSTM